jgi:DNA-binding transcriptional LysR family regulator
LTIGSLETTAAFRLTPLPAGFAANYPDVDFVLRTGTIRKLVAATLEQSVDGAFVCGPVGQPDLREEVGKDGIVPIACVNAARDIFAAPPGIWTRSRTEEISAPKTACTAVQPSLPIVAISMMLPSA